MYKVLALDLDGTLTDNRKEIPPRNLDALMQAQRQGLTIVLASGRPTQGITPLAEQLQLSRHGGYILAYNGGQVIDCRTGRCLHKKMLDPAVYPYLFEKGCTPGLHIITYHDGFIVCEDSANRYVRHSAFSNKMPLKEIDNFRTSFRHPVCKFIIAGEPERLKSLEAEMSRHLRGTMNVMRSEPFFLELLPHGTDKASTLHLLLNHIGAEAQETIACGDGFNDMDMIRYAGLGVAMDNAHDSVKAVADYVAASNESCGVADVVDRFVLGRRLQSQSSK